MLYDSTHQVIGGTIPALPDPGSQRLATALALGQIAQAEADGRHGTYESLRADIDSAEGSLQGYLSRNDGKAVDEREEARLRAGVDRARRAMSKWQSGAAGFNASVIIPVCNEMIRWARQAGKNAVPYDGWTDKILGWFKSNDINVALDGLAKRRDKRQAVQEARVPKDFAIDQLVGQVDRLVAQGKPQIHVGLVDLLEDRSVRSNIVSEARMTWPRKVIDAQPVLGREPDEVLDALPVIMWLARDRVVEEIEKALDARYAGYHGLILTPSERRAALVDANAEIFQAEQAVARLAWGLIDGGDTSAIRFLAGLNGGAILGLHAPKGR
jgi:hypothetical protein